MKVDSHRLQMKKKTYKNILDVTVVTAGHSGYKLVRQSHNVWDPGSHSEAEPRGDEREDAQGCDHLHPEPVIFLVLT